MKKRKMRKWVKVALILISLIGIIKIGYIIGKQDDEALNSCISKGLGEAYCTRSILGVY